MKENHLHICLFQPEIPQNTGNIARLSAASACRLHLIKPLGFELSEKTVRRAGLDYWPYVDMEMHDSLDIFLEKFLPSRLAFFTKRGQKNYTEIEQDVDVLIFGRETSGLPMYILDKFQDRTFKIPIFQPEVRSLNLANAVSIATYHSLWVRNCLQNESNQNL